MVYKCKVLYVTSGDDLFLDVDLGVDGLHKHVRARLVGVDAPNAYATAPDSVANEVRKYVESLVEDEDCTIDVRSCSNSKSGWLVVLFLNSDRTSVNSMLCSMGYAYKPQTQVKNHANNP